MNYLFVLHTIKCGGAEKYIINLANALSEQNSDDRVFLYIYDDSTFYLDLIKPSVKIIQNNYKQDKPFTLSWYFNYYFIFGLKLAWQTRKMKLDYILSGYEELSEFAISFVRIFNSLNKRHFKYISFIHSSLEYQKARSKNLVNTVKIKLLILIRKFWFDQLFLSNINLRKDYKYIQDDHVTSLNPIIVSNTHDHSDEININIFKPYFITFGKVVNNKNHRLLIEILKLIEEKVYIYVFGEIGDDELYKELKDLVEKNNLNNKIFFIKPTPNIFKILKGAKGYICTSISETVHLGILEAMYCSIPVITVPFSGHEQFLNNDVALISHSYKASELSSLVKKILEMNQDERTLLTKKGKLYSQIFSPGKVAIDFKKKLGI